MCAVEIINLRKTCGLTRWEGEGNERCGLETHAKGVKCGVVELVKRDMLMWLGHIEINKSE